MASLYQRFSGQINTNKTFPEPPEASRLLGRAGDPGDRPAESQRARLQPQRRRRCEDEDVRNSSWLNPERVSLRFNPVYGSICLIDGVFIVTFKGEVVKLRCVIASIGGITCQCVTCQLRVNARSLHKAFYWRASGKSI
uniref:Uncharacterized protein n=1 Tax=Xiphophorus couchianus TaxID=32473 RepID=A0A3B5KZ56_9TELE